MEWCGIGMGWVGVELGLSRMGCGDEATVVGVA